MSTQLGDGVSNPWIRWHVRYDELSSIESPSSLSWVYVIGFKIWKIGVKISSLFVTETEWRLSTCQVLGWHDLHVKADWCFNPHLLFVSFCARISNSLLCLLAMTNWPTSQWYHQPALKISSLAVINSVWCGNLWVINHCWHCKYQWSSTNDNHSYRIPVIRKIIRITIKWNYYGVSWNLIRLNCKMWSKDIMRNI